MAKMFYSSSEAAAKLGITEEALKSWVREGKLREFRDAGKVNYKVEEIDKLAKPAAVAPASKTGTGTGTGTAFGTGSGEIMLEPAEASGSSIALAPMGTGTDALSLADSEMEDTSAGSTAGKKKDDTVVTSVGISVFDDEEGEAADPKAKTALVKEDEGVSLEGIGSGSGLLDLTRERDDTSLGAELLDEIYPADEEAAGSGPVVEMGDATRAGLEQAIPETREAEEIFEPAAPVARAGRGVVVTRLEYAADPVSVGMSGLAIVGVLVMLIAGLAVASMMRGVVPGLLTAMYSSLWIYLAGAFVAAGIAFAIGMVLGKRTSA